MSTVQPTWDHNNGNGYFITQMFNGSCDPAAGQGYYMYGLYYCGHTGVDLATALGSPIVHATASGVVVSAGYNGSYGVMVRIRHLLTDGNTVYSQYEHLAYGSLSVYSGEVVTQGQQIGLVGSTGFATGAHLHFELKSVDEDGMGYSFGNASLVAGYFDPLQFVASHQLQPATFISSTGRSTQTFPLESEPLLRQFLKSFRHYVVVSVSDGLHVRSGPGTQYKVLGTALRGAKLGYVSVHGTWLKVALPQNVQGWVDKKYVAGYEDWEAAKTARNVAWPPKGAAVGTVEVLGLNVRSGPGQDHDVTTSVFQDDRVQILTRTTHWARIKTRDGTTGWVLRIYIRESGSPAIAAPSYLVPTVPLLHVRSGPGLQYTVSGSVYSGTKMELVRATPNWAAVILPGGTTGWVAKPLTTPEKKAVPASKKPATVAGSRKGTISPPASKKKPPAKLGTALHVTSKRSTVAKPATAPVPHFVTVTASILNIRRGPGQKYDVVARVKQETTLQVLATTPHWEHVALPASSIDGWVLGSFTR